MYLAKSFCGYRMTIAQNKLGEFNIKCRNNIQSITMDFNKKKYETKKQG